ncbi:MAG: hypothetical protein BMS9Abin37_1133 [Acidobacteriota bacterium]|nr:MAG: hypothetical protein BMS9Abin37_1133 [Acidobacteriota bacterium]
MTDTAMTTTSSETGIDLSRALKFFFDDPDWVPKLLVGTLFALLTPFGIGSVFVAGYAVAVARQAMHQRSPLLPEWDDLSVFFIEGLKGLAISLTHKLPVILLSVLLVLALVGGALIQKEGETFPEGLFYYGLPAILGGLFLIFILSLAVLFYVPAAFVRFIQTDRLSAAFDVMDNVAFIRKQGSTYLTGILAIVVAGFIGQLGIIVFCIGVFPAMFWSACVMGYVIGELARLGGGASSS